jgi:hypothetical protein
MMKFSIFMPLGARRCLPPSSGFRCRANGRYRKTPRAIPLPVRKPVLESCFCLLDLHHSHRRPSTLSNPSLCCLRGGSLGTLGSVWLSNLESIAEATSDGLEVPHTSGTSGLPPLGLLAPVDCGDISSMPVCNLRLQAERERTYTSGP